MNGWYWQPEETWKLSRSLFSFGTNHLFIKMVKQNRQPNMCTSTSDTVNSYTAKKTHNTHTLTAQSVKLSIETAGMCLCRVPLLANGICCWIELIEKVTLRHKLISLRAFENHICKFAPVWQIPRPFNQPSIGSDHFNWIPNLSQFNSYNWWIMYELRITIHTPSHTLRLINRFIGALMQKKSSWQQNRTEFKVNVMSQSL